MVKTTIHSRGHQTFEPIILYLLGSAIEITVLDSSHVVHICCSTSETGRMGTALVSTLRLCSFITDTQSSEYILYWPYLCRFEGQRRVIRCFRITLLSNPRPFSPTKGCIAKASHWTRNISTTQYTEGQESLRQDLSYS